jgi:26S proteasome regulatory subunit N1
VLSLFRKQLAFIIARHQFVVDLEDEEVSGILNNSHLSEHFIALGRELDILEPKVPEDIYKSHLENTRK